MEIQIPSLLRIKPNALHKLGKYLRQEGFNHVALFWGEGIKELFNDTVQISLASAEISIIFERTVASNDIDEAFTVGKKLPQQVQAIVAIGGGKAIDFCKYLAFIKQLPQFAVPTLISNDAFAAPNCSLLVDGKRKTVKAQVPHAVILDTAIISRAPRHFLYSGIGDLFCKVTAVHDWKLAYKKRGELVNDFAATVSHKAADTFSYFNHKDLDNMEYIGVISSSLLMTGIAMIIAGSSRPASGSEHLISHAYDLFAKKPSLHGLQVGVASYAVSFLQEITHERVKKDLLESGFHAFMKENPLNKEDFIKAVYNARQIKENFYTILSEPGSNAKLEQFIETDPLMQDMVVSQGL